MNTTISATHLVLARPFHTPRHAKTAYV